jgi:hypothetical protein
VHHLGPEFQEIAASRAAALTEAYRVLMDAGLRAQYDAQVAAGPTFAPCPPSTASAAPPPVRGQATGTEPAREAPPAGQAAPDVSTSQFVRRAVLGRVNEAVGELSGTSLEAAGFDAAYLMSGRKALFRKSDPTVRLAVKVVSRVDAASVQDAWTAAARMPATNATLCLMVLGSGLAPAGELAGSVASLRRKTRQTPPVVIPVDIRDWAALVPPETPPAVRSVLERLRQKD